MLIVYITYYIPALHTPVYNMIYIATPALSFTIATHSPPHPYYGTLLFSLPLFLICVLAYTCTIIYLYYTSYKCALLYTYVL